MDLIGKKLKNSRVFEAIIPINKTNRKVYRYTKENGVLAHQKLINGKWDTSNLRVMQRYEIEEIKNANN